MAAMGRHGDGGITRRPDGRLQVAITLTSGKRLYRYVPRMDDRAAQRRLADRALRELREARGLELEPERQTLEVYLRSWLGSLRDARHARVRPRTLEFYTMIVEQRIVPGLGGIRLDRLSVAAVQSWVDGQEGSARTIHHCRAVLRRALNIAVRQRILGHNPVLDVELPDADGFEGDPLTIAEARSLLEKSSSSGDRLHALWRLAIITGYRQGELLGLGWDDVDLEGGFVTIAAQLARREGGWIRVATKTRQKPRIALDSGTVEILRAHQLRQATERTADWQFWGLVFVTPSGMPWGRSGLLRAFHAACDVAGVRRRRFHDLRHSSSTLLEDLGVDEAIRMHRLGHVTKRMARRYAHGSEAQDRIASELLGRAIS